MGTTAAAYSSFRAGKAGRGKSEHSEEKGDTLASPTGRDGLSG